MYSYEAAAERAKRPAARTAMLLSAAAHWRRHGPEGRSRLIARLNNRIVRAWVLEQVTQTWTDARGVWARRGSSSNILVVSA